MSEDISASDVEMAEEVMDYFDRMSQVMDFPPDVAGAVIVKMQEWRERFYEFYENMEQDNE